MRFSLLLFALVAAGCATSAPPVVPSAAPASVLAIDGSDADWQGAMRPVDGTPGLSLGVRDDAEALYVAVVASNPQVVRQALGMGLTLWVDADGGTNETFGIRYPVGMMALGGFNPTEMMGDVRPEAMEERMQIQLDALRGRLALVREGEERQAAADATPGLAVALRAAAGTLVAEYRIAYRELGLAPGATLGLGLTTPEIDREAMMAAMGGRRPPGGGMGGGGMRPPGGGGMGGGGMRPPGGMGGGMPKPLDAWVTVQLASVPSAP